MAKIISANSFLGSLGLCAIRGIAVLLLFTSLTSAASEDLWVYYARRLSGGSDEIRSDAIQNLKKMEQLDSQLRKGLKSPFRPLALDVISTLNRDSLLVDLFEAAHNDEDGIVYQTINAFINEKNYKVISSFYQLKLSQLPTKLRPSPAALISILDTLSRMKVALDAELLGRFLENDFYELRFFTVNYLRSFLMRGEHEEYLQLLGRALQLNPYQLRLNTLYTVQTLPEALRKKAKAFLEHCHVDRSDDVAKLCVLIDQGIAL